MGIVTSSRRALVEAKLGPQLGKLLEGVPMVCDGDTPEGKPSPQPVRALASLLGVAPEECLVMEDSEAGVAGAVEARMSVAWVGATAPPHQDGVHCFPPPGLPLLLPHMVGLPAYESDDEGVQHFRLHLPPPLRGNSP